MYQWNKTRMRKYMRVTKVSGRSKVVKIEDMIHLIRQSVSPEKFEDLTCAAGPYYPLKYVLPNEIAMLVVDIIRREELWFQSIPKCTLKDMFSVVMSIKCKRISYNNIRLLLSNDKTMDELMEVHKVVQRCSDQGTTIGVDFWPADWEELRRVRNIYLKSNVQRHGLKFLLHADFLYVRSDIRYMIKHHPNSASNRVQVSVLKDKVSTMKAYAQLTEIHCSI